MYHQLQTDRCWLIRPRLVRPMHTRHSNNRLLYLSHQPLLPHPYPPYPPGMSQPLSHLPHRRKNRHRPIASLMGVGASRVMQGLVSAATVEGTPCGTISRGGSRPCLRVLTPRQRLHHSHRERHRRRTYLPGRTRLRRQDLQPSLMDPPRSRRLEQRQRTPATRGYVRIPRPMHRQVRIRDPTVNSHRLSTTGRVKPTRTLDPGSRRLTSQLLAHIHPQAH